MATERHFGAVTGWYSEIEPAPAELLAHHMPGVPNLGDLTLLDWAEVPPVDILTAGYPCQPFSEAGKRKGAQDARHLWPYIAEGVRTLRPRHVVLENVRGHLTLGFDAVLGSLAEAGFDAEWCLLRASDVGAPHARARLFIVATDASSAGAGWLDRGIPRAPEAARRQDQRVRAAVDGGAASPDADGERLARWPQPDFGSLEPGQRAPLGGDAGGRGPAAPVALLPSPRTSDTNGPGHHGDGGLDLRTAVTLLPTPTARDHKGQNQRRDATCLPGATAEVDDRWVATLPDGRTIDYGPAVRRWELLTGEPAPQPRDDKGRLNPELPRWMMGYPAGWLDGMGRTAALKAAGNAVVPQQALAALSVLAPVMAVAA